MAVRGRKPKPSHLRLLEGNPGHRPINDGEPVPVGALGAAPDELTGKARERWREINDGCPWLSVADRDAVRAYCVAFALHLKAHEAVEKVGLFVKDTGGKIIRNPALHELARQAEAMRKWANELGFTPSARVRLDVRQLDPNNVTDAQSIDRLIEQ